ncbi:DNA cytosine methyltransferase [Burkholderia diffusa]|uniref:DNA cytosine methyltransferase n=1 Tax=Burkholderia diffusa TaxID=488732 RepID=UPI0007583DA2|nr:DNA cytosine methyltransferase [Burkholderia diffusa]KVH51199.1 DNA methyltransferase [Burkholderia diffusa]
MRVLDLCSGISAATVAWQPLGWTTLAFAEIDPFACAVLAHHYPDVPNLGDICRFQEWPDAAVDLLVGGSPCPSFSVAGKRGGLDDPRGALALVLPEVARRYAARWFLWENVPGVLSSHGGRDFAAFLGQLEKLGYGFAYRILDAQYFGLAQRRRRVFVVGCAGNWRAAAAVLFERASLLGHPAPRRQARQALAPTLAARTRSGGGLGTDCDCDGGLIPGVARALTSSNERIDAETETLLVTHALSADGFDASEDGTGRGTPLVPVAFDCKASARHNIAHGDIAPTLRAMAHAGSHANGGGQLAVAFAQNQRDETRVMPVAGALAAEPGMKQQSYVLAVRGRDEGRRLEIRQDDLANALVTPNGGRDGIGVGALMTPTMQVRRLMPIEAERLMGFPDYYTLVPYRGKPAADGPRYRALGNSIAVPVLTWIGRRIALVDALLSGDASVSLSINERNSQ